MKSEAKSQTAQDAIFQHLSKDALIREILQSDLEEEQKVALLLEVDSEIKSRTDEVATLANAELTMRALRANDRINILTQELDAERAQLILARTALRILGAQLPSVGESAKAEQSLEEDSELSTALVAKLFQDYDSSMNLRGVALSLDDFLLATKGIESFELYRDENEEMPLLNWMKSNKQLVGEVYGKSRVRIFNRAAKRLDWHILHNENPSWHLDRAKVKTQLLADESVAVLSDTTLLVKNPSEFSRILIEHANMFGTASAIAMLGIADLQSKQRSDTAAI